MPLAKQIVFTICSCPPGVFMSKANLLTFGLPLGVFARPWLSLLKVKFEFWIITKHEVREKKKKEKVMYIGVDEINEKIKQYFI
jgi:hypothetical protein